MVKLFELFFSPTGGTKKVCEVLSNEFQGEKIKIDLMHGEKLHCSEKIMAEDICLIAVPSFGGRVPVPAVENLKKVKGNQAKAILVVTYGNRAYDDTLLELKDIIKETGFVCIAAITAVAEHSIMNRFGSGRPDEQDKEELKKYAVQIFKMLSESQTFETLSVPGNHPFREYKGLPLHPKAGSSCNECGVCVKICPVGAISMENPKISDSKKCITCMGCVAACPKHARKLNKILLAIASNKMKKVCSTRKDNKLIIGGPQ